MPTLKEAAALGNSLTKLPSELIEAWWISEDSSIRTTFPTSNNPGNISWEGQGVPSHGLFAGVTSVNPNKTVNYSTWQEGVQAWAQLINEPVSQYKALQLDTAQLLKEPNVKAMCQAIGNSNWAASHYKSDPPYDYPGGLLWHVYEGLVGQNQQQQADQQQPQAPAAPAAPAQGKPVAQTVTIQKGDTLDKLGRDHHVPADILATFNGIADPNKIEAGKPLDIPQRYQIQPGDTIDALSTRLHATPDDLVQWNHIHNKDYIRAYDWLYY